MTNATANSLKTPACAQTQPHVAAGPVLAVDTWTANKNPALQSCMGADLDGSLAARAIDRR